MAAIGTKSGPGNALPDHVETPANSYMKDAGPRKADNVPPQQSDYRSMLTVIVVIHLMLVVAMIGVVLLQKSEGGGLVSSTNSGFLTGRGTANVLTRTTALLAAGFFVTSLMLSYIASYERKPTSIIHSGASAGSEAPGSPAPPLSTGGGVLNQLGGDTPSSPAPAAPAPSGPQVPQSK